jgi:hypothetical protein
LLEKLVEMVGVEPTSENTSPLLSTSVSAGLISFRKASGSAALLNQSLNLFQDRNSFPKQIPAFMNVSLGPAGEPEGTCSYIELR